jgi:hypothetical protein
MKGYTDFVVAMKIRVNDHDADVMRQFPDHIMDRFRGTPVIIDALSVNKVENMSVHVANDEIRANLVKFAFEQDGAIQ